MTYALPGPRARSLFAFVALVVLACAEDDEPAATTAATIDPSATSSETMTSLTNDPTMMPSTNPDDGVDDAPADSETSGTPTDVPAECDPGELDCPCMEGECMRGLVCVRDVCAMPMECDEDPNEPNDIAAEATELESISDADADGAMITGVLGEIGDIDWFTYAGTDAIGETVDPARNLMVTGGTLELCKFLDCLEGTELIACPPGSVADESAGHPGCCGTSSIVFDAKGFECEGGAFETGAQVYIRLRNGEPQCVGYTIDYHY